MEREGQRQKMDRQGRTCKICWVIVEPNQMRKSLCLTINDDRVNLTMWEFKTVGLKRCSPEKHLNDDDDDDDEDDDDDDDDNDDDDDDEDNDK